MNPNPHQFSADLRELPASHRRPFRAWVEKHAGDQPARHGALLFDAQSYRRWLRCSTDLGLVRLEEIPDHERDELKRFLTTDNEAQLRPPLPPGWAYVADVVRWSFKAGWERACRRKKLSDIQ